MNQFLRYFLIFLGIALVAFIVWYFKSIVTYILVSAVLSLIGRPVVDFLDRLRIWKFHLPRAVTALLALAFLWVLFITFFRVFLPMIARQASELSNIDMQSVSTALETPLAQADRIFRNLRISPDEEVSLMDYLSERIVSLVNVSTVSNIFGSLASLLGNIAIAIFSISFLTFFFLKDEQLFLEGVMLFVPVKHEEGFLKSMSSVKRLLMRYFIGIGLQITGIITLVTLGLSLVAGLSFENAIVIGLLVGILNVIPYLGPWIGAILGMIIGVATHIDLDFSTQLLPMMGYMILTFVAVQIVDNVIFQPFIYGTSVMAHPIEIFLVIMIAGSLAGIAGMILAIPVYTVLRVFAKEFFSNYKLIQKITEKI